MENKIYTQSDLAKLLKSLLTNDSPEAIAELKQAIKGNENIIGKMANQSYKVILKQLTRIRRDYFSDVQAIDEAVKIGALADEVAKIMKDNWGDLSTEFSKKQGVIEEVMTVQGNLDGFIGRFSTAAASFNAYITTRAENNKEVINTRNFQIKAGTYAPYRLEQLVLKLLKFNFYSPKEIYLEGKEVIGEDGKKVIEQDKVKGFIPAVIADEIGLSVAVTPIYDVKKGVMDITLNVVDKNGTRSDVALLIDTNNSTKAIVDFIREKLFLINSRQLVKDFRDEVELIDSLFIKPLSGLFRSTFDESSIKDAAKVEEVTEILKKELLSATTVDNYTELKNPMLEAILSIIEDGENAVLNDNETVARISKLDVIARLFQGKASAYNKTISVLAPTQSPLDRRFAVAQYVDGDETIDFLIMEYGIKKTKIWLPLDTSFIAPKIAINQWETMNSEGITGSVNKSKREENGGELYTSIPSDVYNPDIE